jgi:hypothetical protein
MAISFVEKDKLENQKPCEVIIGDDTYEGTFERCPRTGDLRVCCESADAEAGFGDNVKSLPRNQPATIRLKDGSNGEYSGKIADDGKFIR